MSRLELSGLVLILFASLHGTAQAESVIDLNTYGQSETDTNETVTFATDEIDLVGCCEPSCGADDCCGCGDGVGCGSGVAKKAGPGPCAKSHKGLFYLNDFSYLKDPCYDGWCLGDNLKLMPVAGGDWGTLDIGGQFRLRMHDEIGMGREGAATTARFQDTNTDFMLSRLRLYANWKVSDRVRFYVEGIHADTTTDGGDYFPRPIDRNRGDFTNLFVDVKLTDSVTARVGRQELVYGAQRLVSVLDWANTRRTFDGAKVLYKKGDWAVDTLFTYFTPVVFDEMDEADSDRPFYGTYATYSGFENFTVDAYYLGYENNNVGSTNGTDDFSLHTLGLRINGGMGNWLWEMEGGPQFGRQSGVRGGVDHSAGFATAGLGRKCTRLPGGTTIWFYYDYATGDDGNEAWNDFNQLFPLAHKYLGFIDAVARTNVQSPNILLTCKPGPKWNFLMWYYNFRSVSDGSVPAIGNTPAQNAGDELGDELDLILKYTICPRSNALIGWSKFWAGDKINATQDAEFLYAQYLINF